MNTEDLSEVGTAKSVFLKLIPTGLKNFRSFADQVR